MRDYIVMYHHRHAKCIPGDGADDFLYLVLLCSDVTDSILYSSFVVKRNRTVCYGSYQKYGTIVFYINLVLI